MTTRTRTTADTVLLACAIAFGVLFFLPMLAYLIVSVLG